MKQENKKLAILRAVNRALEYRKENPVAYSEEIMKHVAEFANSNIKKNKDRILAISAANLAVRFIEKKPKARDKEIMQHIVGNLGRILDSTDR